MWTAWRCRSERTPSQHKAFNSYVLVRDCLIFSKQKALHGEGFFDLEDENCLTGLPYSGVSSPFLGKCKAVAIVPNAVFARSAVGKYAYLQRLAPLPGPYAADD